MCALSISDEKKLTSLVKFLDIVMPRILPQSMHEHFQLSRNYTIIMENQNLF